MQDPLYLQQVEHSCKMLYICNKRSTQIRFSVSAVRSPISATRGALMEDHLYLQHEEHSCKILYIWHVMPIFIVLSGSYLGH